MADNKPLPKRASALLHAPLADAAFALHERLEEAKCRQSRGRRERLQQADEALRIVRVYLRLALIVHSVTPATTPLGNACSCPDLKVLSHSIGQSHHPTRVDSRVRGNDRL